MVESAVNHAVRLRGSAAQAFEVFQVTTMNLSPDSDKRVGASPSVSDLIGRFGTILLGPNHTVDDRLLLLLEQILKDELTPSAAACVHQRAPLV